ncbi:NAD(P)/FAD-dependent oxidoreductase [Alkalicaulis satelles]|uniref:NAD(P)/FAD-dependent oxidoreductase n=1 Tax=Alkalicaulis satelles TaxID=2609175 RepID=A0A5M6ZFY2_9PROT|nr:NAD(P)/FAD-dependent oxidoreductase [Alkalicaulis satelles]KAA5803653.1 NAD(P)/FAD-dependent oxidoreductase [Alkalicaulis satelles]
MAHGGEGPVQERDVLIVGAGLSGVGAAWHLQHRCPDRSYAILEARAGMGGTWDLFRYPGIRSDSDMYTFGYAFRPWTDGKVFADGPSIRRYVEDTASEAGINRHIRFGRRVTSASWDSATARWTLTADGPDGRETWRARFIMLCSGYYRYDRGYMPEFEGLEDFKGRVIHPQHWPEDTDYAGRRVVVIGSGATAVTLVPAMAESAAHVIMLQRSPTYIAARPQRDAIADFLRKILPGRMAYGLTRIKNIGLAMFFFQLSRRWPGFVKKGVLKQIRAELGADFDVERHFTPRYDPWDQRFCLAPEGDFFQALKSGQASIVTDQIDRFTPEGVRLKSGEVIEADLVIPATGLEMQVGGGIDISVDGAPFTASETITYRGMMLSGVPNAAMAFGYTNASWTLKIDLTCERVCRMLTHMARTGADYAVPVPPGEIETLPLLDFSSGYVQRALPGLPRQGARTPWKTHQNYVLDMLTIRFGRLEDGHLQFRKAGAEAAPASLAAAAE